MKPAHVATIVFIVLAILHQDIWNWDKTGLVLGFLPVGLAYHAAYSITAAVFWFLVSKFAWPSAIEEWADRDDSTSNR